MPATFRGRLQTALILAITLVAITFTTVLAAPSQLSIAKGATARFNSLVQAGEAGYGLPPEGPLHECIASFDNTGAMGFHYINGNLLDGVIDPAAPEALQADYVALLGHREDTAEQPAVVALPVML